MALTKTQGTSVLALQSVLANTQVISSVQTLSTEVAATLFVHIGRQAIPDGGPIKIRVEASAKSSGNGYWFPLQTYIGGVGTCRSTAVSGTVSSGTGLITVGSTEGFKVGDLVFIQNGTLANSEFGRIKSIVDNTSITIEDNLANAQTSSTIFSLAESFQFSFDASGFARIRVIADGIKCSQAFAVDAFMVTAV